MPCFSNVFSCSCCQLGQNHFPFPPKQSVEELKTSTDVHKKLLITQRADASPQQPDSSTDGSSSVQFLTFIQYKRKGTNSLHNYPIIAYCQTTKNWRVRITIIWNQRSIFQLFPENCCTDIKKTQKTISTVKLKKSNSMTRIKLKVFGSFLQFIRKCQKEESRDTGTVSLIKRHRYLIKSKDTWEINSENVSSLTDRKKNRYSSFNSKIINLVAMLSNAFLVQIIKGVFHDENVTN